MTILTDERRPIKTNRDLPSPYFMWRKLTYVGERSYTYWVLMEYLRRGSGIHKVVKFLGRLDGKNAISEDHAFELAWEEIGDAREGIPVELPIEVEIIEIKPDDAENLSVEIEGKVIGGYCSHRAAHCHYLENDETCLCEQKSISELEGCRFMQKREVVA